MADTCKQLTVIVWRVADTGGQAFLVSLTQHHCFLTEGVKYKDECRNQGTTLLCIQSSTQLCAKLRALE